MPPKLAEPHERLRFARKRAGFRSINAAAAHFGWRVPTYAAHEGGIRAMDRSAYDYAKAFNVSFEWLRDGVGAIDDGVDLNARPGRPRPSMVRDISDYQSIPIVATVGAGTFLSTDYDHMDEPIGMTDAITDRRFPYARHIAFKVSGDSMNLRRIEDGDILHCVDWAESGLVPVTGMVVVVEERKFDGQAFALTVKEVEVRKDEVALLPRSSNQTHRPIVIPKAGDGAATEFRIVALAYNVNKPLAF